MKSRFWDLAVAIAVASAAYMFGQLLLAEVGQPSGFYILTSYGADGDGCVVFSRDGRLRRDFPGDFCTFIPGTGFVTFIGGNVELFDATLKRRWSRSVPGFHHALRLDRAGKRVYVLSERRKFDSSLAANVIGDQILGFDLKGKKTFSWDFFIDGKAIKTLAPNIPFHRDGLSRDLTYQTLHLNSIDVLQENFPARGPAFKKGNILLTSLNYRSIFILDAKSGKIQWSFTDKDYWGGIHSARIMNDGRIVYFRNGDQGDGPHFSELIVLNPSTRAVEWRYRDPVGDRFYSRRFGHVEVLPNGSYLVTDNPGGEGHAFEVRPDKSIVWQWTNPRKNPDGRRAEVFQIVWVPDADLADFTDLLKSI